MFKHRPSHLSLPTTTTTASSSSSSSASSAQASPAACPSQPYERVPSHDSDSLPPSSTARHRRHHDLHDELHEHSPLQPLLQDPDDLDMTLADETGRRYSRSSQRRSISESDDLRLEEMGYKPELERNYSIISLLALGFSITNSWYGLSASLVTGISSGGPVTILYGICLTTVMSLAVAISLAELASAYPNSGGQYYWTAILAPQKHARFLSFMCGSLTWAGAIFTCASVAIAVANSIIGMYVINHPGTPLTPWKTFVTYELVNVVVMVFNFSSSWLPRFNSAAFYTTLISFFVILVAVVATASPKQDPKFVFATFFNETGWDSAFIAVVVGLLPCAWCFACLDSVTHMAEEIPKPERNIPKALLATVVLGFLTAFPYGVGMFFSMSDLSKLINSETGVPIFEVYRQALRNDAGASFLAFLVVITGVGCIVGCHTWQARLCWSFSRDCGLPGSHIWASVNPKFGLPINAHLMSNAWVAVVGLLFLVSTSAFNACVTACVIFLYLSYSIPIACLLWHGRDKVTPGPFWLGKLGAVCNVVVLVWTLFTLIFFSFPPVYPVTATNMNYVSAVIGVFVLYCVIYWYARGNKVFRGASFREQTEEHKAAVEAASQRTHSEVEHSSIVVPKTDD